MTLQGTLDQVELAAVRVESEDLHGQLAKYGQVIKAYGTQHTPPSRNTITRKEINTQKKEERKKNNPTGRRDQHVGHKGVSASRKADQTIRHTQDKCSSCGGTNLKIVKIISTIKTDVPPTPKVTTTCRITKTCERLYCGEMTKTGLEPDAQKLRDSLKDADFLGYDETSCTIMGKNGWAWVAASHDLTSYHSDASRSRTTFEEHVCAGQPPSTDTPYTTH